MTDALRVLSELRAYATYDPATGHFIRRKTTAANARAGEIAGSVAGGGYRYLRFSGHQYRANRLAWLWMMETWPEGFVDHANGDRSDDRWENLRAASNGENCANARLRRDNSTGFKGVKLMPSGRWQARIGAAGGGHLGTFDTAHEAAAEYERAAAARYGRFARMA